MVISPRDARIYAAQDFAFAEINQDAVSALLTRPLPDGGGDTLENIASSGGPAARVWIQAVRPVPERRRWSPAKWGSQRSAAGGVEAGAAMWPLAPAAVWAERLATRASASPTAPAAPATRPSFRVSGYGSQAFGGAVFSAALSYAHGWDTTERASGFGLATTTRGGDAVTGAAQLATPFQAEGLKVTPAVGVMISSLTGGGFAEHDAASSAFAVTGSPVGLTAVSPFASVGLSHAFTSGDGLAITPDVQLGYRYDGAGAGRVTLVAQDGTVFLGNQVNPNPNAALLGASLTAHKAGWSAFVKYRATVSSNWLDQSVAAGLRIAF